MISISSTCLGRSFRTFSGALFCVYSLCYEEPFDQYEVEPVPNHPFHQQAASSVLYTTSCKHSLVHLRLGEIIARKMLSWLKSLIKLSLMHLFGCLYYFISDARSHKHQASSSYAVTQYRLLVLWGRVVRNLVDGRNVRPFFAWHRNTWLPEMNTSQTRMYEVLAVIVVHTRKHTNTKFHIYCHFVKKFRRPNTKCPQTLNNHSFVNDDSIIYFVRVSVFHVHCILYRSGWSPARNCRLVFALESCLEARSFTFTPFPPNPFHRYVTPTTPSFSEVKLLPYWFSVWSSFIWDTRTSTTPPSSSQSFFEALESYIRGPLGRRIKLPHTHTHTHTHTPHTHTHTHLHTNTHTLRPFLSLSYLYELPLPNLFV